MSRMEECLLLLYTSREQCDWFNKVERPVTSTSSVLLIPAPALSCVFSRRWSSASVKCRSQWPSPLWPRPQLPVQMVPLNQKAVFTCVRAGRQDFCLKRQPTKGSKGRLSGQHFSCFQEGWKWYRVKMHRKDFEEMDLNVFLFVMLRCQQKWGKPVSPARIPENTCKARSIALHHSSPKPESQTLMHIRITGAALKNPGVRAVSRQSQSESLLVRLRNQDALSLHSHTAARPPARVQNAATWTINVFQNLLHKQDLLKWAASQGI